MQFNSEANNQDLISDITFWTGQDTGNYSLNDRCRNINSRLSMIWQVIFEAYGGWQFMDANVSGTTGNDTSGTNDGPYATQTIANNQPYYSLPTGALTIVGIQVKQLNGTFNFLIPITPEEFLNMGGDGRFPSLGVPIYYMPYGNDIRLLPTPNYTQASSIRIHFDQDFGYFVPGDTTKVPGFAATFHRALSIGAALDFGLANPSLGAGRIQVLNQQWENFVGNPEKKLTGTIQAYYSKRYKARFPHRIGSGPDLVEEFR